MTVRAARRCCGTSRPGSRGLARTRRSTEPTPAPKRIVVTGGAGLVGRAIIRELRERGDEVLALVRDPAGAKILVEIGTDLAASDLSSVDALTDQLQGADAVIHAAGSYRV